MSKTQRPQPFGARLRELRESKGWTVYRLSQESGVNQTQIGRIERGERSLTAETLQALLTGLGKKWAALD